MIGVVNSKNFELSYLFPNIFSKQEEYKIYNYGIKDFLDDCIKNKITEGLKILSIEDLREYDEYTLGELTFSGKVKIYVLTYGNRPQEVCFIWIDTDSFKYDTSALREKVLKIKRGDDRYV